MQRRPRGNYAGSLLSLLNRRTVCLTEVAMGQQSQSTTMAPVREIEMPLIPLAFGGVVVNATARYSKARHFDSGGDHPERPPLPRSTATARDRSSDAKKIRKSRANIR